MHVRAKNFNQIVAFDVAKGHLDYHIMPANLTGRIDNTKQFTLQFLKKILRQHGDDILIVCEATGGYERILLRTALSLSLPLHRAEGRRIRLFAQAQGLRAKTDALDAAMIALYASQTTELRLHEELPLAEQKLKAMQARREEMLQMLHGEKCRFDIVDNKQVKISLKQVITMLTKQLKNIEQKILQLIKKEKGLTHKSKLMQSLKGVGPITTMTLLATMPELGTLSKGQVAALAGLAPYNNDSGNTNMRRHVSGGRFAARRCLFMAATVAIQHNPLMRKKFEALTQRGKPYKVALVAIMRKMIIILNAILKSGEPWKGKNMT